MPKVRSHELASCFNCEADLDGAGGSRPASRALRSPASRARCVTTAAHSSGSDEQIFGADEQVPGRGQGD